jgi:hypothetical protein
LLRADFFDSDSFFENEMQAKLEQSRSVDGGPALAFAGLGVRATAEAARRGSKGAAPTPNESLRGKR